jgi:hypothetical protein
MNLAFEWRRRQKIMLSPLEPTDLTDESRPSALGQMIQNEQIERLLEATSKLDEPARSVVIMRFMTSRREAWLSCVSLSKNRTNGSPIAWAKTRGICDRCAPNLWRV